MSKLVKYLICLSAIILFGIYQYPQFSQRALESESRSMVAFVRILQGSHLGVFCRYYNLKDFQRDSQNYLGDGYKMALTKKEIPKKYKEMVSQDFLPYMLDHSYRILVFAKERGVIVVITQDWLGEIDQVGEFKILKKFDKKDFSFCMSKNLLPEGTLIRGDLISTSALYCPDNTCEVLKFKEPVNNSIANDVLWSYLFGVSDYIYLESWRPLQKNRAFEFIKDYGQSKKMPLSNIKALKKYVKEIHKKSFKDLYSSEFSRCDEGKKMIVPLEQ